MMTKEKIARLIELSECCVSKEGFEELYVLKAEFKVWDPEAPEEPRCNCDFPAPGCPVHEVQAGSLIDVE